MDLNHQTHKKGFTLVELLIFMAIYSVLIVMTTNILTSTIDIKLQSEATSSVQEDGNFILARLTHDMSQATDIVTPVLGTPSSTLQLTINGVNHTYQLNTNNLQITNSLGTDNLNSYSTRISNLNFTRLGNSGGKNAVQVSFTLTSRTTNTNGSVESKNFLTTLGLR